MKIHILLSSFLIAALVLFGKPAKIVEAQAPILPPPPPVYSSATAHTLIYEAAERYGVSGYQLYTTLRCESGLNPNARGDYGTSFGLAQIHLPAHPEITKEEALNPLFAMDWTAAQFAAGRQSMWTCWRWYFA